MPEFWKYTTRYIQNHVVTPIGETAARYDGIATTWQRSRTDMRMGFVDEPRYFEIVRPDEEKFLNVSAAAIVYAQEQVVQDGPEAPVKWLALLPYRAKEARLASRHAAVAEHVRRLTRSDVIDGLSRGLAAGGPSLDVATCFEAWFDSLETARDGVQNAVGDEA